MSPNRISRDQSHFQRLYDANPDPWHFRSSEYEQAKYRKTVEALEGRRFKSALEVGCSIGVLTRLLAPHCDALLAVDVIEQPLAAARVTCADQPWVHFRRMQVPDEWPDGSFDLIVLSEVLYFLASPDIMTVADRVCHCLAPAGRVVLVNWRGHSDDPTSGEEAAATFVERARSCLTSHTLKLEAGYRLDVLNRR